MISAVVVREWRRRLGLTQGVAAGLVGVSRRTWVRWEGGGGVPHGRGDVPCFWRLLLEVLLEKDYEESM